MKKWEIVAPGDANLRMVTAPKAMAHLRRGAFGKVVVQVRDSELLPHEAVSSWTGLRE